MATLFELLWGRGDARKIMREARKRYYSTVREDPISAHVALASTHDTLVKRYTRGLWWPLALWHIKRAIEHIERAIHLVHDWNMLTVNQLDVMSRIWSKAPEVLGGNPGLARNAIEFAIGSHQDRFSMKPHTKALMYITLMDIEWRNGSRGTAWENYSKAYALIPAIEQEDSPDREQQLVRVMRHLGWFYIDHGDESDKEAGWDLILLAITKADSVAKDQGEEIRREAKRRGVLLARDSLD